MASSSNALNNGRRHASLRLAVHAKSLASVATTAAVAARRIVSALSELATPRGNPTVLSTSSIPAGGHGAPQRSVSPVGVPAYLLLEGASA